MTMNVTFSPFLVQFGSYFTGAVLICEKFFHWMGSKYPSDEKSSDPRQNWVSSNLFWRNCGVFAKCWRCTASLHNKNKLQVHGEGGMDGRSLVTGLSTNI